VVFDACRNTLKLTQPGSRAVVQSKGFVPVAQENGMLIAYATAEEELASDVGVGAGPYAKVLAEEVVKPAIEAVAMFRIVQRRVRAAIRQEPYLGFSALGDLYLAGKELKLPEPAPMPARLSEAAEAWGATKDTTSIAALELFISSYKDSYYAGLARLRIAELNKQQVMVVATHASTRTTQLYDRREDRVTLDEVVKKYSGIGGRSPRYRSNLRRAGWHHNASLQSHLPRHRHRMRSEYRKTWSAAQSASPICIGRCPQLGCFVGLRTEQRVCMIVANGCRPVST
jgi:hypothetical protein